MRDGVTISAEGTQPARLAQLLSRWLERPLYRSRLAQDPLLRSQAPGVVAFQDLPFITKLDMRHGFPRNFLPVGQALEPLLETNAVELEHTSGTSDERTPVLLGRGWWREQELRALRLNSFIAAFLEEHPSPRRVVLTTPVCNGTACHSRWAPRSARTDGDSLYINQARIPFLVDDAELSRMVAETSDWEPQFLDLDPVHGAWFALHCERRGVRFPSLRFIVCTYEFTSVVHRRILERVFGVPVFNLFGSTETGHLLMEDAQGTLRPSLETAFLEVVAEDSSGVGDLVVTTLSNDYMPLVRYRIGDLVQRQWTGSEPCYVVHGRARDALRGKNGQRVTTWQVDHCFEGVAGIAHYQLRQQDDGACILRYLPEVRELPPRELRELSNRISGLTGQPVRAVLETTQTLVPEPSGKFRLTARVT